MGIILLALVYENISPGASTCTVMFTTRCMVLCKFGFWDSRVLCPGQLFQKLTQCCTVHRDFTTGQVSFPHTVEHLKFAILDRLLIPGFSHKGL
ncbi:hypothetical protein HOY80DRAFT_959405 [Tuber brumale]|nr:hypothetical protein HOY80DRAFT_959405 [Tuber brumale]